MIDLFLNEKSLTGQFETVKDFCINGIPPIIDILKDVCQLSKPCKLYKSETISNALVTTEKTFSEIIYGEVSRIHDEIRRYKLQLTTLIDDPFWDKDSMQNPKDQYMSLVDGMSLNGSSIAETSVRDGILVSFMHDSYKQEEITFKKNTVTISVSNVWQGGQFLGTTYKKKLLTFQEYVARSFINQKINFTYASEDKVWRRISNEKEAIVFDAFKRFCDTPWVDIPNDNGLEYHSYHKGGNNVRFFSNAEWKKGIKEFRISGKSRCFGYQEDGFFYLLMIDMEHVLGNI